MNPDIIQLQKKTDELEKRLNQLSNSSQIPRDVETAFRERLGLVSSLSGLITLVAGQGIITNGKITSTSNILLTRQTANGTLGFLAYVPSNGTATIYSFSTPANLDTSTISYLILT